MTDQPTAPGPTIPPPPKPTRKGLKVAGMIGGAVVLLAAGVGIGAAANAHSEQIASQQSQIQRLRSQLITAQEKANSESASVVIAQEQASTAKEQAATATSTADAKAKAQWASRMAAVTALQRKLQQEQGVVQASTISADGVYVVGKDIPSGTYHTSGGGQCYYATLGSTNTFNIIDNNNFNGPETVSVAGAYAFQIQGGCTWVKIG